MPVSSLSLDREVIAERTAKMLLEVTPFNSASRILSSSPPGGRVPFTSIVANLSLIHRCGRR